MAEARPRVWVSQPLFDDIVDRLQQYFEVVTATEVTAYTPEAIAAQLRGVDGAVVTLNERIGPAEIAGAPRLRVIANVGVGYNNLDIAALGDAGILATNTPDVLTGTTADLGFALLMAAARRITESERWLREGQWGQWSFSTMLGADVHGSTLGILGMGRIGQEHFPHSARCWRKRRLPARPSTQRSWRHWPPTPTSPPAMSIPA